MSGCGLHGAGAGAGSGTSRRHMLLPMPSVSAAGRFRVSDGRDLGCILEPGADLGRFRDHHAMLCEVVYVSVRGAFILKSP